MESFKIFNFNKEGILHIYKHIAIDDPGIYKEEDTLLRRLIKEKIYEI